MATSASQQTPSGANGVARVIVVIAEPIDADLLRAALQADDLRETELLVVAPALNDSALAYWVSDADEAIAQAEVAAARTASKLSGEGATVLDAEVGESDAAVAVGDALRRFPAERIVVFRHPPGEEAYRERLSIEDLERFEVPVTERFVAR